MKKLKILTVIPARGGSKGVPRKNIRLINGKPMVAYAIRSAIDSGVIDRPVVSTEDKEIATIARRWGVEVIDRPVELAGDGTSQEAVMEHALDVVEKQGYSPDYIALIQCTSPLLTAKVIQQAVQKVTEGFDACLTAYYPESYEWKWKKDGSGGVVPQEDLHRKMRQDLNLPFHENGAFYITKTELFKKNKSRYGGHGVKTALIEMNEIDSLQVDNEHELWLIEQIMKKQDKN